MLAAGRSGFPFFSGELVEGSTEFVLVFAFLFASRTSTGDGCFSSWATSLRQKTQKIKEDEKITMKEMEGRILQVNGVQKAPQLRISPVVTKEKELKKEKKKSKLVGWSTATMEEKERNQEFKDSEEMEQRRSIDQEGINKMWKTLSKQNMEEVLEKYKVEVRNRGAYKGRKR